MSRNAKELYLQHLHINYTYFWSKASNYACWVLPTSNPRSSAVLPLPLSSRTPAKIWRCFWTLPIAFIIHWLMILYPAILTLSRLFVLITSISCGGRSRSNPVCINDHSSVNTLCTNLARNLALNWEQWSPPGPLWNENAR